MTDALGNPIVIGNKYGYSRNQNGFTTVRIGIIVKINEKSVSMQVTEAKISFYDNKLKDEKLPSKKISMRSDSLFPINS
jgi:hypothetical protein